MHFFFFLESCQAARFSKASQPSQLSLLFVFQGLVVVSIQPTRSFQLPAGDLKMHGPGTRSSNCSNRAWLRIWTPSQRPFRNVAVWLQPLACLELQAILVFQPTAHSRFHDHSGPSRFCSGCWLAWWIVCLAPESIPKIRISGTLSELNALARQEERGSSPKIVSCGRLLPALFLWFLKPVLQWRHQEYVGNHDFAMRKLPKKKPLRQEVWVLPPGTPDRGSADAVHLAVA